MAFCTSDNTSCITLIRSNISLVGTYFFLQGFRSRSFPALDLDFSDHLSYWREGFPALMIGDTAFLRSRRYHQADDTFETLDYARMAQVVQGAYAVATQP